MTCASPCLAQDKSKGGYDISAVQLRTIFDSEDEVIEGDYRVGSALIFDCKLKVWLCVNSDNFSRCRREREESLKLPGMLFPCAPIVETSELGECVRLQYLNIQLWQWKIFCLKQSSES